MLAPGWPLTPGALPTSPVLVAAPGQGEKARPQQTEGRLASPRPQRAVTCHLGALRTLPPGAPPGGPVLAPSWPQSSQMLGGPPSTEPGRQHRSRLNGTVVSPGAHLFEINAFCYFVKNGFVSPFAICSGA